MSTRQQRIKVFEDTQSWIEEDPALSESIDFVKQHTEVFYEEILPDSTVTDYFYATHSQLGNADAWLDGLNL